MALLALSDSAIRTVDLARQLEDAHEVDADIPYPSNWLVSVHRGRKNWTKVLQYGTRVLSNEPHQGIRGVFLAVLFVTVVIGEVVIENSTCTVTPLGSGDDTPQIKKAFQQCSSNSPVVFQEGTYNIRRVNYQARGHDPQRTQRKKARCNLCPDEKTCSRAYPTILLDIDRWERCTAPDQTSRSGEDPIHYKRKAAAHLRKPSTAYATLTL
ncbi:hypothetical protein QBC47DRAFT_465235 [Echria macrotheca]|uniref:Uncharacterized protein n=1 Tax=Echria macrotheca TaxID=438768 RepID=A0AAJ0B382_9PEZI|nr:hypothetical protein QBC47DRAFT_465235 [Echria macrotheca]